MRYYFPKRLVKFFIILLPLICIQAWGNYIHAQTRNKQGSAADSAARARQAQLEAQRVERQRILDSTRAARAKWADSAANARRNLLELQRVERQKSIDSAKDARLRIADSMKAERQRITDSIKTERARVTDSIARVRKQRTDSLEAVRKYRESKRYRDSVTAVRQQEIDTRRATQQAVFDSIKAERKRITDSTLAVRKAFTDSIRAIQKQRADSLTALRKYRESKRYRDSVAIVRQGRMDSIRLARQRINDSIVTERKRITDSLTAARTHTRDSITAVRKAYIDSITAVRKVRADSLAKIREQRERDREVLAKTREKQKQMALELKVKKKREAWSNEKMLKKKWSIPRRIVQNTFTRYNYFFNARNKMNEALRNMQRTRKENYDSVIALFPFDPNRDSTLLASDMDSIIQKTSVGIQIHDPRTKWSDDLYLLMGQAYYYKGDYKNAAVTFKYIVSIRRMLEEQKKKNKKNPVRRKSSDRQPSIAAEEKKNIFNAIQHRTAHNEGLLWLARTYAQSSQPEQAESVIELLGADPKFPEHLQGRLALEKSYLHLKQGNEQSATQQLAIVSRDKHTPKWLRMRAAFINGQLAQQSGNYLDAASSFRDVIAFHPNIEMDFYARKHLAYSLMYAGGDQEEAIASLKSMLKDGKYIPYYEQIYFVLGRLAANSNNTKDAIVYLQKSIDAPKSTNKQKAISFATMGDVHYTTANYTAAKQAYDSAALLASSAPEEPLIQTAVRRSQALDKVTAPLLTIRTQDSLLHLATLPEKEQRQIIRKHIRRLEQERADSIFRAENALPKFETSGSGNSDFSNWYFSNPVLVQQGINEFKRKWGNRKLADNWRRSAAAGFTPMNNDLAGTSDADAIENSELDENGLPTEESLMAAIPTTPERQDSARRQIQRGYVDLGSAYLNLLEDYPRAISALDTLEYRYPQHPHQAEVLYLRYLTALRQDQLTEAQEYSTRLQREYPSSKFAELVRPAEGMVEEDRNVPVEVYYDNTYSMLQQRQFADVIQRAKRGKSMYSDQRYNSRFSILEATALAGSEQFDQADSAITTFINNNPADTLIPWAHAIKDYITRNRPAIDSMNTGQLDSLLPKKSDNAGQDSLNNTNTSAAVEIPNEYTYNPREPHYFMFVFPSMGTKVIAVRAALTDFNNLMFSEQNLSIGLETLNDQGGGAIVIRQFETIAPARNYLRKLQTKREIFREFEENEYYLLIISARNYQKLLHDKDIDTYQQFYKSRYR